MGVFDIFKKGKPTKAEQEHDDSISDIATAVVLEQSIQSSSEQAAARYYRPDYNPQTRKQYYDDGSAHKTAMDQAFVDGKIAKDPYTGVELMKKQRDAKAKYGADWQKAAAEADHIDPLSRFFGRTKKNPFLTTDDIREIGNAQDNFQVLSRVENQGSKGVGKGGSTQEEWASDSTRMEGLEQYIETGESIEEVSERIRNTGKTARQRNDRRATQKSIRNATQTAHDAGMSAAYNAGVTSLTISGIMNIVSVIKGEKSGEEAVADTIKTSGKAVATGYVMGGGMTTVTQTLSYSSSNFVKSLAQNNVPAKVLTAVLVTGDTLKKWGEGEITTQECLLQLGDKGLNIATMGYAMTIGQTLIPIPIVGGAIGALVGSMLTSNLYNNLINDLQTKQLEHNERLKIMAECKEIAKQAEAFRKELEQHIEAYFIEYRACFDEALSTISLAYAAGDADGVIAGANQITRKLGGQVRFETVQEFKTFLDSDEDDIL